MGKESGEESDEGEVEENDQCISLAHKDVDKDDLGEEDIEDEVNDEEGDKDREEKEEDNDHDEVEVEDEEAVEKEVTGDIEKRYRIEDESMGPKRDKETQGQDSSDAGNEKKIINESDISETESPSHTTNKNEENNRNGVTETAGEMCDDGGKDEEKEERKSDDEKDGSDCKDFDSDEDVDAMTVPPSADRKDDIRSVVVEDSAIDIVLDNSWMKGSKGKDLLRIAESLICGQLLIRSLSSDKSDWRHTFDILPKDNMFSLLESNETQYISLRDVALTWKECISNCLLPEVLSALVVRCGKPYQTLFEKIASYSSNDMELNGKHHKIELELKEFCMEKLQADLNCIEDTQIDLIKLKSLLLQNEALLTIWTVQISRIHSSILQEKSFNTKTVPVGKTSANNDTKSKFTPNKLVTLSQCLGVNCLTPFQSRVFCNVLFGVWTNHQGNLDFDINLSALIEICKQRVKHDSECSRFYQYVVSFVNPSKRLKSYLDEEKISFSEEDKSFPLSLLSYFNNVLNLLCGGERCDAGPLFQLNKSHPVQAKSTNNQNDVKKSVDAMILCAFLNDSYVPDISKEFLATCCFAWSGGDFNVFYDEEVDNKKNMIEKESDSINRSFSRKVSECLLRSCIKPAARQSTLICQDTVSHFLYPHKVSITQSSPLGKMCFRNKFDPLDSIDKLREALEKQFKMKFRKSFFTQKAKDLQIPSDIEIFKCTKQGDKILEINDFLDVDTIVADVFGDVDFTCVESEAASQLCDERDNKEQQRSSEDKGPRPPSNAREFMHQLANPPVHHIKPAKPFPLPAETAYAWGIPTMVKYLKEVIELPQYEENFYQYELNGYSFICLDNGIALKVCTSGGEDEPSKFVTLHAAKIACHAGMHHELLICDNLTLDMFALEQLRDQSYKEALENLPVVLDEFHPVHVASIISAPISAGGGAAHKCSLQVLRKQISGSKLISLQPEGIGQIGAKFGCSEDDTNRAIQVMLDLLKKHTENDSLSVPRIETGVDDRELLQRNVKIKTLDKNADAEEEFKVNKALVREKEAESPSGKESKKKKEKKKKTGIAKKREEMKEPSKRPTENVKTTEESEDSVNDPDDDPCSSSEEEQVTAKPKKKNQRKDQVRIDNRVTVDKNGKPHSPDVAKRSSASKRNTQSRVQNNDPSTSSELTLLKKQNDLLKETIGMAQEDDNDDKETDTRQNIPSSSTPNRAPSLPAANATQLRLIEDQNRIFMEQMSSVQDVLKSNADLIKNLRNQNRQLLHEKLEADEMLQTAAAEAKLREDHHLGAMSVALQQRNATAQAFSALTDQYVENLKDTHRGDRTPLASKQGIPRGQPNRMDSDPPPYDDDETPSHPPVSKSSTRDRGAANSSGDSATFEREQVTPNIQAPLHYLSEVDSSKTQFDLNAVMLEDAEHEVSLWRKLLRVYAMSHDPLNTIHYEECDVFIRRFAVVWCRLGKTLYDDAISCNGSQLAPLLTGLLNTVRKVIRKVADADDEVLKKSINDHFHEIKSSRNSNEENRRLHREIGRRKNMTRKLIKGITMLSKDDSGIIDAERHSLYVGLVFALALVHKLLSKFNKKNDFINLMYLLQQLRNGDDTCFKELLRDDFRSFLADHLGISFDNKWHNFDAICQRLDPARTGCIGLANMQSCFRWMNPLSEAIGSIFEGQLAVQALISIVSAEVLSLKLELNEVFRKVLMDNIHIVPSFDNYINKKTTFSADPPHDSRFAADSLIIADFLFILASRFLGETISENDFSSGMYRGTSKEWNAPAANDHISNASWSQSFSSMTQSTNFRVDNLENEMPYGIKFIRRNLRKACNHVSQSLLIYDYSSLSSEQGFVVFGSIAFSGLYTLLSTYLAFWNRSIAYSDEGGDLHLSNKNDELHMKLTDKGELNSAMARLFGGNSIKTEKFLGQMNAMSIDEFEVIICELIGIPVPTDALSLPLVKMQARILGPLVTLKNCNNADDKKGVTCMSRISPKSPELERWDTKSAQRLAKTSKGLAPIIRESNDDDEPCDFDESHLHKVHMSLKVQQNIELVESYSDNLQKKLDGRKAILKGLLHLLKSCPGQKNRTKANKHEEKGRDLSRDQIFERSTLLKKKLLLDMQKKTSTKMELLERQVGKLKQMILPNSTANSISGSLSHSNSKERDLEVKLLEARKLENEILQTNSDALLVMDSISALINDTMVNR